MTRSSNKVDAIETAEEAKRPFVVGIVSAYLLVVGVWLLLTRQVKAPGIGKILLSRIRARYRGELTNIRADEGFSFVVSVPAYLLSDKDAASTLVLLEDGRTLGPAHSSHDEIRRHGLGRYSHWGSEVYFSSSDNSDPHTNGRLYHVEEVRK